MSNLTVDILYGNNYSEPLLLENPIRYVANKYLFYQINVDDDTFLDFFNLVNFLHYMDEVLFSVYCQISCIICV